MPFFYLSQYIVIMYFMCSSFERALKSFISDSFLNVGLFEVPGSLVNAFMRLRT